MPARGVSSARQAYFRDIQDALKRAGISQPTLVVDHARLRRNISRLGEDIAPGMALRIVAKSLPCAPLLQEMARRIGTDRFMTFNREMLGHVSAFAPGADQLLGKPLPVAAAAQFYSNARTNDGVVVHWLIDTVERLQQYLELARARSLKLNVVLELDVGLHRGGFAPDRALRKALRIIAGDPGLTLTGFMGYEAHLSKLPAALGLRRRALRKAHAIYAEALRLGAEDFGVAETRAMIRNAAGSPTFRLYQDTLIANEVSVGSAVVKPGAFDTDLLRAYEPAMFIATPALKVGGPMKTPVLEPLDGLKNRLKPGLGRTIFIHGGYWKAKPVDPPGLSYNAAYGRSSNQELLNGRGDIDIHPDDFVFLRPDQSEAVMLQFGDIAVYEDGAITGRWPVFPVSA